MPRLGVKVLKCPGPTGEKSDQLKNQPLVTVGPHSKYWGISVNETKLEQTEEYKW